MSRRVPFDPGPTDENGRYLEPAKTYKPNNRMARRVKEPSLRIVCRASGHDFLVGAVGSTYNGIDYPGPFLAAGSSLYHRKEPVPLPEPRVPSVICTCDKVRHVLDLNLVWQFCDVIEAAREWAPQERKPPRRIDVSQVELRNPQNQQPHPLG